MYSTSTGLADSLEHFNCIKPHDNTQFKGSTVHHVLIIWTSKEQNSLIYICHVTIPVFQTVNYHVSGLKTNFNVKARPLKQLVVFAGSMQH